MDDRPLFKVAQTWAEDAHARHRSVLPIRTDVFNFAIMMEDVLQEHDHKGGYDECDPRWLLAKLNEEVGELGQIITMLYRPDGRGAPHATPDDFNNLIRGGIHEAVDIANVAMMLASVLAERFLETD